MGAINGSFNIDIALSAAEGARKARVLSSPRVTTQNNVEAEIAQGTEIPIQTTSNNTTTVTFKDAALKLRVVPQITAANTVIMKIVLENGTPGRVGRQRQPGHRHPARDDAGAGARRRDDGHRRHRRGERADQ